MKTNQTNNKNQLKKTNKAHQTKDPTGSNMKNNKTKNNNPLQKQTKSTPNK